MIADRGGQIRTEIKRILHQEGFRGIIEADNLDKVKSSVKAGEVDALFFDAAINSGAICDLIRDIRNQKIGPNPFIIAIAMAQDPSREDIMRVINSGCDDLILKPISVGMILKRLFNQITARKKYVVTSSYTGPTRRSSGREQPKNIPEYEVPNPLRAKAVGGPEEAELHSATKEYKELLASQNMERKASLITRVIGDLIPLYGGSTPPEDAEKFLIILKTTCDDLLELLEEAERAVELKLCKSLSSIINSVASRWREPDEKDLKLLPELSRALFACFSVEGDLDAFAKDISATIDKRSVT